MDSRSPLLEDNQMSSVKKEEEEVETLAAVI